MASHEAFMKEKMRQAEDQSDMVNSPLTLHHW